MEIMEDRHAKASTIIASQLPVASWYDVFGDDTIADAVLDRVVHSSHRIELKYPPDQLHIFGLNDRL
jgi:DNA replication protein DnaC